jgi:heptosyltransferase-1
MRLLVIKTSSMGDILHTLPAITEAKRAIPSLRIDWLVEESFAAIPAWHPAVEQVLTVNLRHWRRNLALILHTTRGISYSLRRLRATEYDLVLDVQGLLKSALLGRLVRAKRRCGYTSNQAREGLASLLYTEHVSPAAGLHAVDKLRHAFAQALGYAIPSTAFQETVLDYGIAAEQFVPYPVTLQQPYVVLVATASWTSKLWPLAAWQELAARLNQAGYTVYFPCIDHKQKQLLRDILASLSHAEAVVGLTLPQLASLLRDATAVVSLDTGLAHMANMLGVPTLALYGPTDPNKVGVRGLQQKSLQSPYYLACQPCEQRTCILGNVPCLRLQGAGWVWQHLLPLLHTNFINSLN